MPAALTQRLERSLGDAFALGRELGGGGMARVFLARDAALDRDVVIKALDLETSAPGAAERFRLEVRVIAKLQHPHIIPVLTAGGDDTLLWYAMPYVAGESLRARIVREGALPLADAVRITREVLDALAVAHERGIVHRDIKPENILLEGRHAMVADFGVAKALADAGISGALTTAGLALGTPAYMAPEQGMADPTTNHRADLYATGAVLYEMLTGAPPYSGGAQAVIAAHITAPIPRVEHRRTDVPPAIAQLIQRLLAKNAAERPQSAQEAHAVLDAVVTPGAQGLGSGQSGVVRHSAPSRTRRTSVVIAVAAVIAVLAVIAVRQLRSPSGPIAEGADVIAVIPLGTTDSSLAQLGRDLVVTLSTSLDGVGSIRAADAMAILMRAATQPQPIPLDAARALGRGVSANSVVHGSLVRDGANVRATVSLVRADDGGTLAQASASAPADSIRVITDSLVVQLLKGVWQHGTPPSPFLADVATASPAALKAFLEGEVAFARLDINGALAAYSRAVEADSQFAQAYLRRRTARSHAIMAPDSATDFHVRRLRSRLPLRDQQLLALTGLPFLEHLDSARALAARYPDHPMAQYAPADQIIHNGPPRGIAMSEALPYLDALDSLAPTHVDNAFHRWMVAGSMGDTVMWRAAAARMVALNPDNPTGAWVGADAVLLDARKRGAPDTSIAGLHGFLGVLKMNRGLRWFPSGYALYGRTSAERDSALSKASRLPEFADVRGPLDAARAHADLARGDYAGAIRRYALFTGTDVPAWLRSASVRASVAAAWLGAATPAQADAVFAQWRAASPADTPRRTAEAAWMDGLIGISADDSGRVVRAMAAAAVDTSRAGRGLVRSLRALWRVQRANIADSVQALEDDLIRDGGLLNLTMPLHRLAIGRWLVRAQQPERAERYLMWVDTRASSSENQTLVLTFEGVTSYLRARAFDAAHNDTRAIQYYQRYLELVDRPPPSMRTDVDGAKARLGQLLSARR